MELPRDAYFTGDVVIGDVLLEVTQPAETRGLSLDILGREGIVVERRQGDSTVAYRSQADILAWRQPLAPAGVLPPGAYRFPFRFQIPESALPSYAGTYASVGYDLTARLDVPWWPDATYRRPFYVYYARESVRTFSRPVRFRSGGGGPEVYVEIDGDRFFSRELIGIRITILRLGEAHVRRVYVRLVGGESATVQGYTVATTTYRSEVEIPIGVIRVGTPFTFEIPIPAEVPSSYRGTYSYYSYVLQVGLDIAWAADLVAQTPIVIVR